MCSMVQKDTKGSLMKPHQSKNVNISDFITGSKFVKDNKGLPRTSRAVQHFRNNSGKVLWMSGSTNRPLLCSSLKQQHLFPRIWHVWDISRTQLAKCPARLRGWSCSSTLGRYQAWEFEHQCNAQQIKEYPHPETRQYCIPDAVEEEKERATASVPNPKLLNSMNLWTHPEGLLYFSRQRHWWQGCCKEPVQVFLKSIFNKYDCRKMEQNKTRHAFDPLCTTRTDFL